MTKTADSPIRLYSGGHDANTGKMCFNEAIAFIAGERHSAMPVCASPVVRRFGMVLNDRLDDKRRQLLRPFVLRSLGTALDGRDEERREMCTQWLLEHLPALLERAGLPNAAKQIRDLDMPPTLAEQNVLRVLRSVRDQAWEARQKAFAPLRQQIREAVRAELARHDLNTISDDELAAVAEVAEVAVAVAAAAEAVAEVAEVAAVAVAEAAEVAVAEVAEVAVAVAAAAVAVAEVAEVAAAAAEAAAEVAAAAAAAAAPYSERWWKTRDAIYYRVRDAVKAKVREIYDPGDEILKSALELFDRMLPAEPLQEPAVENAEFLLLGEVA
jgi:hypothetical protein